MRWRTTALAEPVQSIAARLVGDRVRKPRRPSLRMIRRMFVDLGVTPMESNDTGTSLQPYRGADAEDVALGGELDKARCECWHREEFCRSA